MFKNKSVSVGG